MTAQQQFSEEGAIAAARLREYVQAHQVDATLIHLPLPMPTVALAAVALGVDPGQIVKSIVFEGKKRSEVVVLAIAPGDLRVDARKVAAASGRPALKLARPEVVLRASGYAVGGVPPIGHDTPLPVVIDRRVLDHAVVYGGGGDEHHMLRLCPADIVRLTAAVIADITVAAAEPGPTV
jgi:Cys-tRNA(Pro) deacylase